jgi:hypothetical protein
VQLLFVAFIASLVFNAVALAVWRLDVGSRPIVLDGWRLVPAAPESRTPDTAGAVRPAPGPGAQESGDPYNARLRLHVTHVEEAKRVAIPFLDERTKKWQMTETAPEEGGTSVIDFDLRLKKSVDLAAFIRELEQGDPHVARVELLRSKSKKPKDE